ncbi:MAG TPA: phosphotransferase [Candidatus Nanopelagicales bacterium]
MTVDLALARRLVADQLAAADPAAAAKELRVVASGWDNLIVRLGDTLVLRLPVREEAAQLVRNEARWLAEAVAPLHVPTPVPVFVGAPTDAYPWPWLVTRWIEGTVVTEIPVEQRGGLVAPLADALLALHRPAPADAPPNPYRGVPLAHRDTVIRARIRAWPDAAAALEATWDRALAAPAWPGPPLWLHGDPHPANLLASGDRIAGLAGILDFGDLTAGDPANDLATAWWCFGAEDRARFRDRMDASGRYDAHVWTRAGGWAAAIASALPGTPLAAVGEHTVRALREG